MSMEVEDSISKDLRNLFRLTKPNEATKERIIKDIRKLFEQEGDYYEPVNVGNSYSDNHIE